LKGVDFPINLFIVVNTMDIKTTYTFVFEAHRDQLDKSGVPYYHHPFAVAGLVAMNHDDPEYVMAALLHDVVEDTDTSLRDLLALGYSHRVVDAVDLVSRRPEMTYFDFIRRLRDSGNEMALAVKRADIKHNLTRLTPELKGLEKRYAKALTLLDGETS